MSKIIELTDEEVDFIQENYSRFLKIFEWFSVTDPKFETSMEKVSRNMNSILEKLKTAESEVGK